MRRLRLACAVALAVLLLCVGMTACNKDAEAGTLATSYDIVAEWNDEAGTLTCRQDVAYANATGEALDELVFNLPANGFREDAQTPAVAASDKESAYYGGASWGGIEITALQVDGAATEIVIGGEDANALIVPFVTPLAAGASVLLSLEYVVTVPDCVSRFGAGTRAVNLNNFYPVAAVRENGEFVTTPYYSIGDPFYAEAAAFYLTFSAPQEYVVATSGEVTERYVENGIATLEIEAEGFRDVSVTMSRDFSVVSDRADGVEVNYFYLTDPAPAASLATAVSALKTFSDAFGDYAFPSLNVVETDLLSGGMEYCGQVLIDADLTGETRTDVIVHEVAHQWWYCGVGSNQIANAWQDEGLADFSTALYYKLNGDQAGYDRLVNAAYEGYEAYSRALKPDTTDMTRALGEYATNGEYVMISYMRGTLLFQSLYEIVGEDKFLSCLSKYYGDFCGKTASVDDLVSSFASSRKAVAPIFDAYVNGKVIM